MSVSQAEDSGGNSISADQFVALLVKCERRVRGFITTLHPHFSDVDEILQDTSVVAWKKLSTFRYTKSAPDEEFVRWVCMIARLELNNFRRKRGHTDLVFDDALLDKLSDQYGAEQSRLERRHEALMDCVDRLRPRDQEMVRRRYQGGISVRDLASCAGRTVDAIYKTLARIRGNLLICIERRLREEGVQ
jgi:RNA polymerase sigma-70 factor (ECF subfamily)